MTTKPITRLSLVKLKRWPTLKRHLAGKRVRIYSRQWGAWWRPMCSGYTKDYDAAGIWLFEAAWECAKHGGPEKGIQFVLETETVEAPELKIETWHGIYTSSGKLAGLLPGHTAACNIAEGHGYTVAKRRIKFVKGQVMEVEGE